MLCETCDETVWKVIDQRIFRSSRLRNDYLYVESDKAFANGSTVIPEDRGYFVFRRSLMILAETTIQRFRYQIID